MTASAAVLLTGCGSSGDITASVAPPPQADTSTQSRMSGGELAAPGQSESSNVVLTPHQHGYLDALAGAGVYRSSDLTALSIGSYICQARAAGQGDQAVWDFVLPLVRGDIDDTDRSDIAQPKAMSVNDATAQYIRIASERLC